MREPGISPVNLIPVIPCGGADLRLWPVSRELHAKSFVRLAHGQSLLQKAFLRGAELPGIVDILTVTNRELFFKTNVAVVSCAIGLSDSDHAALTPLKIVADPGKGAAGLVVRQPMPHRPFEFVPIQGEPDGTVPNPLHF